PFRNLDGPEMLTLGRDDPDAARSRAVDVPFLVDLDAVGSTDARVAGGIEEERAIRDRAIGQHAITQPLFFARLRDVQILLVRREGNAIGPFEVLDHELQFLTIRLGAGFLPNRAGDTVNA